MARKNLSDSISSRNNDDVDFYGRKKILPNFTSLDDFEDVADEASKIFNEVINKLSKNQRKALEENNALIKKYSDASLMAARKKNELEYKEMSVLEKKSFQERLINNEKIKRIELETQKELLKNSSKSHEERIEAEKEIERLKRESEKREQKARAEAKKQEELSRKAEEIGLTKAQKKKLETQRKLADADKEYQKQLESYDGTAESQRKLEKAKQDRDEAEREQQLENYMNSLVSTISGFVDDMVQGASSILTEYSGKINARLQGTDLTFSDVKSTLQNNLTGSPFVQIKDVLSKVADLSESGIAYNLELRAFLGTVSENIAETFDVANSTLLRLIKLQQADSTLARLGMEATLTKFLNEMYEDTSYLSDLSKSVDTAILEASSQLSRDMSEEFEFTVDKWLGSLYSVGASDSFITQLAQGLNYLGTGNVTALASNTELQTLFAMASSRSGLSYADILLNGLNAENTNTLLKEIVEYLGEIAQDQNQVVKSAYSDVYGFDLSDLRAIANLTTSDINNISSTSLTYAQAVNEVQNQLYQMPSRMTMAALLNNAVENFKWTAGSTIASDPALYLTYTMAELLDTAGDIPIPEISVAGFGIGNLGEVANWVKLGVAGIATLPTLISTFASAFNGMGLMYDGFNFEEYTSRGTGFTGSSSLEVTKTSGQSTSYVASGSTDDITSTTTQEAMNSSNAPDEITSGEYKNYRSVEDIFTSLVDPFGGDFISTGDTMLHNALRVGGASVGGASLEIFDPNTDLLSGALNENQNAIKVSNLDSEKNSIRYDEISVNTANTVIVLTAILSLLADMTGTSNPISNLPTTSKLGINNAMSVLTGDTEGDMTSAVTNLAQLISDGVRSGIIDASVGSAFGNIGLPT